MLVSDDQMCRFPEITISGLAEMSDLRRSFASWLRDADFGTDRVEDLSVVLSELVANAVRVTPPGGSPATVGATVEDGALHLEVTNQVDGETAMHVERHWDLQDPLRTGGRGLLLVSAFVDDVDVKVDDERLVLRCTASR